MTPFVKWMAFCYKTVICSDSVSYVFLICPLGILSWEMHAGGLAGHFDQKRIIEAIKHQFYWPSSKKDVAKIIGHCRTCQLAKQQKQIAGPYTPPCAQLPLEDVSLDFN